MSEVSFHLQWHRPAFEGDDRHLLFVGAMAVGAVFANQFGRRSARYRVWMTKNMNPVDGFGNSVEAAKIAVEARVREALALMVMVTP